MIIKYDADGNVKWAQGFGGDIDSVTPTLDEGYIAIGGDIIKYDKEGKEEWTIDVKGIGNSVVEISDGIYIY